MQSHQEHSQEHKDMGARTISYPRSQDYGSNHI
jgi:hypothetical protein